MPASRTLLIIPDEYQLLQCLAKPIDNWEVVTYVNLRRLVDNHRLHWCDEHDRCHTLVEHVAERGEDHTGTEEKARGSQCVIWKGVCADQVVLNL